MRRGRDSVYSKDSSYTINNHQRDKCSYHTEHDQGGYVLAKGRDRTESKIPEASNEVRSERVKLMLTSDTHYGFNHKTHQRHENFLKTLQDTIESDDIKCVIHAGDWSVNKQDQFYHTMKMFRKHIDPSIPIAAVRGNHDFWDLPDGYKIKRKRMFGELQNLHREWFEEHNIHHLETGPLVVDDVIICGFDGWYGKADPPTNDEERIIGTVEGCPAMVYLSSRAYKELDRVLDTDTDDYAKAICVTHFPPFGGDWKNGADAKDISFCANPKYLQPITEKFDVFCMGHSHQRVDRIDNYCRLLNSGSDYNMPRFLVFEV